MELETQCLGPHGADKEERHTPLGLGTGEEDSDEEVSAGLGPHVSFRNAVCVELKDLSCLDAGYPYSPPRRVPEDAERDVVQFEPAKLRLLKEEPYLGSRMTQNCSSTAEVSARIGKARYVFHQLAHVWKAFYSDDQGTKDGERQERRCRR